MEKKIGLLIAVISSMYFLAGCRTASVESDSFIVSTPLSSYNSDIITFNEQESTVIFLYDTLSINYYFNFPDTIGGFRPRCIVDSFIIEFFDENDNRIPFVHYSTGDRYDLLHFEVNTEVEPNAWIEAKVDLFPSWLKAYYNPIYNLHQGNPSASPEPLKTRAHYTFFAHELNTKQEFITEFNVTVVFANFADEQ